MLKNRISEKLKRRFTHFVIELCAVIANIMPGGLIKSGGNLCRGDYADTDTRRTPGILAIGQQQLVTSPLKSSSTGQRFQTLICSCACFILKIKNKIKHRASWRLANNSSLRAH
jgi:hypothetical protein